MTLRSFASTLLLALISSTLAACDTVRRDFPTFREAEAAGFGSIPFLPRDARRIHVKKDIDSGHQYVVFHTDSLKSIAIPAETRIEMIAKWPGGEWAPLPDYDRFRLLRAFRPDRKHPWRYIAKGDSTFVMYYRY